MGTRERLGEVTPETRARTPKRNPATELVFNLIGELDTILATMPASLTCIMRAFPESMFYGEGAVK